MINTVVDIKDIIYSYSEDNDLVSSIEKRGIAIPVHVNKVDDGYICVDGHKRLTACQILSEKNEKFRRIPILILNDYSKAGSAFWGNTQNKH